MHKEFSEYVEATAPRKVKDYIIELQGSDFIIDQFEIFFFIDPF